MKDLMGLIKQAREMQDKVQDAQAQVAALEVEGRSGASMVTITLTGDYSVKALKIDPDLLNGAEVEIVEDLIVAAFQDAKVRLNEAQAETMKSAFGDIQLPPGMKMPF
ncbi:MAG: YbaB/EbfC family nucleoid-associated protein [Hyphomonadaceae bacterium]|nr:YbaB/EbfC family nucleoid-associated protein [Hyphomonadaceae bacterium]MBC6412368.1 YbaB/EbfC family nucleoid-associated protein [Hyphomonadaceae bacterium]